jgi:hypothetical protein
MVEKRRRQREKKKEGAEEANAIKACPFTLSFLSSLSAETKKTGPQTRPRPCVVCVVCGVCGYVGNGLDDAL